MGMIIHSHVYSLSEPTTLPSHLDCIIVSAPMESDPLSLLSALNLSFPRAQKHIATSCKGFFNQDRIYLDQSVGIFGFQDPQGSYGSAAGGFERESELSDLVLQLLTTASLRAERSGELPSLVWISATPGFEEQIIDMIQSFYQTKVMICGGSAADDLIAGQWWISDQYKSFSQGIVLTTMYASTKVFTRLSSGYFITEHSGVVTSCDRRLIKEIDHQPAGLVYHRWNQQRFPDLSPERTILEDSTYIPLATVKGSLGSLAYFQVIHPKELHSDLSISTFANIELNQQIYQLRGDEESVIGRPRRVIKGALLEAEEPLENLRGALIIFCAGCFLAVEERIEEIWRSINQEIPNVPILCQFTFGEQGVFPDGECVHGNLMISVVLFVDGSPTSKTL